MKDKSNQKEEGCGICKETGTQVSSAQRTSPEQPAFAVCAGLRQSRDKQQSFLEHCLSVLHVHALSSGAEKTMSSKQYNSEAAQKYAQPRVYPRQYVSIPASWLGEAGNSRTFQRTVTGKGTLPVTETYQKLHGDPFISTTTYEYGIVSAKKQQFIVVRCIQWEPICSSWDAIDIVGTTAEKH
jgi:hypothetical protein